jgi:hypothetical protein
MAYTQSPGRLNMPKTGRGVDIPTLMTGAPGTALYQRTQDPKKEKAPVTPPKKKETPGFFSTVSNAYSDAYKDKKGTTKSSSVSQGAPGSGSRKSNKDLSVGVNAALKAGFNYLTKD